MSDSAENKEDIKEDIKEDEVVAMPGMAEQGNQELISMAIEEAIQKESIDTVLLKEVTDIEIPSYLIDMTNVGDIMPCTLDAISKMLSEDGDTAIYMKNGDSIGIIGYGEAHQLYSRLDTFINNVYSGKCGIYKNNGDGFKKIKPMDVNNIMLDI